MISINSYAANSWGNTSSLAGVTAAKAVEGNGKTAAATGADATASISSLARQLSEAAERAAARDASMTTPQLAAKARALETALVEYNWSGMHNTDIPETDDPELLARAEQATKFVNGRGKNPFAGLSREQLVLIMYDEGDAFTINERYSASHEYHTQRALWNRTVTMRVGMDQNSTELFTEFYKACIAEYQEGSLIEQATYPPNYVSRMEYYIQLWEGGGGSAELEHMDLLQLVLEQLRRLHDDDENEDGDTSTRLRLPKSGAGEYDRNLSWGLASTLSIPDTFAAASPQAAPVK
ncbi:MAG: hypothetical protein LBL48_12065 [Azoarcus sp.]|jgi:hypothetical protein|nr:hypothetical protein [Azoarcus sp.]